MFGALLYRAALAAERTRQEMFQTDSFPTAQAVNGSAPAPVRGTLNGKPFQSLSDSDPRIGEKLEVFAAGDYMWISYADIASIQIEPPKKLRDLLWAPAQVVGGPTLRSRELGEVLLPVISPLSYQHPDDDVRLGRATEWCADENGDEAPYGFKKSAGGWRRDSVLRNSRPANRTSCAGLLGFGLSGAKRDRDMVWPSISNR